MPTALPTGKLPAQPARPRLQLRRAIDAASLTQPPAAVDYTDIPSIGMLANDQWGDCVEAGVGHVVEQDTRYATGVEQVVTDTAVLDLYSALTGFNRNDPATDRGTVVQDALEHWRRQGVFPDPSGKSHKIAAFAAVDLTDWAEIENAVALFGQVVIGFNFPDSAMDQFDGGQPWTVVPGSRLDGGHCVVLVGYDADWLYVLTWGRVQRMARPFWTRYCDEAWVVITAETVKAEGVNAFGGVLNLAALGADFAALTGEPNPFPHVEPAPPSPEPSPAPSPAPAPDPARADEYLAAYLRVRSVRRWLESDFHAGTPKRLIEELRAWLKAQSV